MRRHLAGSPEGGDQRGAGRGEGAGGDDADGGAEPHRPHCGPRGPWAVVGAERAGHRRRGPEHQEDEECVPEGEDPHRQCRPGQFLGAQVAEDGRVADVVERVGGERHHRRYGEGGDPPVEAAVRRRCHGGEPDTLRWARSHRRCLSLAHERTHSSRQAPFGRRHRRLSEGARPGHAPGDRHVGRGLGQLPGGGGVVVERGDPVQHAARPVWPSGRSRVSATPVGSRSSSTRSR